MNESTYDQAMRRLRAMPERQHGLFLYFLAGHSPDEVLDALDGWEVLNAAMARHQAEQARAAEAEQDAEVMS